MVTPREPVEIKCTHCQAPNEVYPSDYGGKELCLLHVCDSCDRIFNFDVEAVWVVKAY